MKNGPLLELDDDGESVDGIDFGTADWKASPGSVLETVDALLKPFGVEIVLYECSGDAYEFSVQKREA